MARLKDVWSECEFDLTKVEVKTFLEKYFPTSAVVAEVEAAMGIGPELIWIFRAWLAGCPVPRKDLKPVEDKIGAYIRSLPPEVDLSQGAQIGYASPPYEEDCSQLLIGN